MGVCLGTVLVGLLSIVHNCHLCLIWRPALLTNMVSVLIQLISNLRDALDGSTDLDQGPIVGGKYNITPTDGNGLAFFRSVQQVLNIVYGNPEGKPGLFFPHGLNGTIK